MRRSLCRITAPAISLAVLLGVLSRRALAQAASIRDGTCATEEGVQPALAHYQLLSFLQATGGYVSPKLRLVEPCETGERGVFASELIPAEELLVSLPRTALVTVGRLLEEAPPDLHTALEKIAKIGSQHQLLHLLFLASQRLNASSFFAAYFATLPTKAHDSLHLSAEELQALQPGSKEREHVDDRNDQFSATNKLVAKWFPTLHEGIGGEDALRWAYSMVSSRAFQVSIGHDAEEERALLPFIDMFNHRDDVSSHVFYEPGNDTIGLRSLSSWLVGEEVYISYGDLAPHILFAQHGIRL